MKQSTSLKYIDAHCHLNFPDYDSDREAVIKRAQDAGVGMIIVGTTRETSARAVEIAEQHENMWAIIGLHPISVEEELGKNTGGVFDYDFYFKLAQNKKVVGIGECGYDYYRTKADNKNDKLQHEAFFAQIDIANKVQKPLMLHLRSSKTGTSNAYRRALDTLKTFKNGLKVRGDAHFFAGKWEEAQEFLDLGFTLSFTGVVTFCPDYDEVIKKAPLDRILSETDAPFVTPAPHRENRGMRNEPAFVIEIAHRIAEIRGEDKEVVLAALVANTRKLFSI